MLVTEELNLFASITAGRVPAQKLPAMVEDAAMISSNLMGLFHKKIIVETTKRYTLEFQGQDLDSTSGKTEQIRKKLACPCQGAAYRRPGRDGVSVATPVPVNV